MRGEYTHRINNIIQETGSPPHARGIPMSSDAIRDQLGITPACAGNTTCAHYCKCSPGDHPRMRGEYTSSSLPLIASPGSSPHARGIPGVNLVRVRNAGITPACAGNTKILNASASDHRDHPRMRGEYCLIVTFNDFVQGSPPHARGILAKMNGIQNPNGITPACAGNTRLEPVLSSGIGDHPRMRGEYETRFFSQ